MRYSYNILIPNRVKPKTALYLNKYNKELIDKPIVQSYSIDIIYIYYYSCSKPYIIY